MYATPGEKPELERTLGALGTFHQRGMPIEADFVRGMPRYGVSCRSICNIIIRRETTKARAMSCSSRHLLRVSQVRQVRLAVENGLADYSSTTGAPHECFGQVASIKHPMSDEFFHYAPLARPGAPRIASSRVRSLLMAAWRREWREQKKAWWNDWPCRRL